MISKELQHTLPVVVPRLMETQPAAARVRVSWLKRMFRVPHFEFWDTHVFHFPIYLYWLWLSLRARSFFFFSASNPGIETGGMLGESKYDILAKIDPRFLPKTIFYDQVPKEQQLLAHLEAKQITFPFVVKPDVGQGGWMVTKINSLVDLRLFLSAIRMPFMVQEFVDAEMEWGLLYYRFPGSTHGTISSLALKELLTVTGDGSSTVRTLIAVHPRGGEKTADHLKDQLDLHAIPFAGERVRVSFKANHSYGTAFRNCNALIDGALTEIFDRLCSGIEGFYFGRFDLRSSSLDDLRQGKFKILELNGSGSEPLHIFDPSMSLREAYRSALGHWNVIYKISRMNHGSGTAYLNLGQAREVYRRVNQWQHVHRTRYVIGNA
jgi:hypothetical protein